MGCQLSPSKKSPRPPPWLGCCTLPLHGGALHIGVDFGGAARARAPPIIEKCPCIYHLLPPFAPPKFWFALPIFLTSLCQWQSLEPMAWEVNCITVANSYQSY